MDRASRLQAFWNDLYAAYGQQSGILLPYIHPLLQKYFPQALWRGNPQRREIALTFDDGPHLQDTPQLLEVLARYQVQATFFMLGEQVQALPDLVRSVALAGHHIGIHGYRHEPFPLIGAASLRAQLDATRDLICTTTGRDPEAVRDVRPPYGVALTTTVQQLRAWNYRPVMWGIVPLHWYLPTEATVRQVLEQVTTGSLLVLHETQAGPSVAAVVTQLLPQLLALEYTFVTVEQMWQRLAERPEAPEAMS